MALIFYQAVLCGNNAVICLLHYNHRLFFTFWLSSYLREWSHLIFSRVRFSSWRVACMWQAQLHLQLIAQKQNFLLSRGAGQKDEIENPWLRQDPAPEACADLGTGSITSSLPCLWWCKWKRLPWYATQSWIKGKEREQECHNKDKKPTC